MEPTRFGIKRKLVSTKEKAFKLFRLMGSLRNKDSNVSSPNQTSLTDASYQPPNLLANHALEVELKKAEALEYWRKWLNRPS